MMRYSIVLLALLLCASGAIAQPVDSLIQEALRNNSQLKSLAYQVQGAEYKALSSEAWPAPSVAIELSQIPTISGNVIGEAISNNISLSQMFMLGGKLSAMSDVERKRGRLLEQNLSSLRVQVRSKLKMDYVQLWLIDRRIELQERSIRLMKALADASQPQVVTNRMPQADLYTIQAEVASQRAKLSSILAQRATLQNVINTTLGRNDLNRSIRTDSTLPAVSPMLPLSRLEATAVKGNPSLLAMDRMREMNDAEATAARRELFPDVMLQAMVMRMPNGMLLTGGPRSAEMIRQSAMGMSMQKTDWMYSLMASITLPFAPWSSGRSSAKAEEMRVANLGLAEDKASMQREMLASLRSALTKYASADSLADAYETEILPLMRQSAEAQTTAYQNGRVPITTVLDSRRMEVMKQDDYLMVLMDRQMAAIEVEMMIGSTPP